MPTLKTGNCARFDSFAGMIPCRVLAISGTSGRASTEQRVTFRITRAMGAYKAGDTLERSGLHIVPREAVFRRKYKTVIGRYDVQCDSDSNSKQER